MPVYRIGQKNVLFIHIPKTAGMALDAHLSGHGKVVFNTRIKTRRGFFGPRHQPAAALEAIFLPEMIDYAFTIVRHPVARMVSEYRYQRRHNSFQLARFRMFGFDTWLRYVFWRVGRDPDWRSGHFRPQVAYECFGCEVFRYEDGLERVMQGIAQATDTALPYYTPERNASPMRQVSLSRASLDRIIHSYRADFDRFGYADTAPALPGVIYTD